MQSCTTPTEFEKREENGTTFWRWRVETGSVMKEYRLFSADTDCSTVIL
jgi:hypothetical protein